MSKMIKYEYRKNIGMLFAMLGVYAALELYWICSVYVLDNEGHVAASLTLMVLSGFATYFFVLISSVLSYSRELKQKSGYLVFMTPVSTYKILGAKLITAFINGIVLVCGIAVMLTVGFKVASAKYGLKSVLAIIDEIGNLQEIIVEILAFIIMMLIIFYMTITVAYLAESLCATVFENRKGKGIISIIIFVLIFVCVISVANHIPLIDADFSSEIADAFVSVLPQLLWYIVVSVASFFSSAVLLEKKISL